LLAPAVGAFLYWVGNLFALALPATLERGWDSRAFAASVKLLVNFYLLSGYMVGGYMVGGYMVGDGIKRSTLHRVWNRPHSCC